MRRREFIGLFGAVAAWPLGVRAQEADRIPRIGQLFVNTAEQEKALFGDDPFGFRDLGYIEGKNIAFERRYADGDVDRLTVLAQELVDLKVDVIATAGEGFYAAHRVTTALPIVAGAAGDLVGLGTAASLAHPGGNVTGSAFFAPEMLARRLELLKETVPSLTRAGVLMLHGLPYNQLSLDIVTPTARALNVELLPIEVTGANGYEGAFSVASAEWIGGLIVAESGQIFGHAALIVSLADKRGLPTVAPPALAAKGALPGYGVNLPELWRHAATFVDKILKGAKPDDIPIERATRFTTAVNLKTAKALGIAIPPAVLAGADEVIE